MKTWRCLAVSVAVVALALGLFIAVPRTSVQAVTSAFTPNQELPLPLTAGTLPLRFVVRALEPSNQSDEIGTVYVGSIRGVPGGIDMHRWSAQLDGPPNPDGTLPFKYLGQPDNCGLLSTGCDAIGIAEGGGDMEIATGHPGDGSVPNLAVTSQTLTPGETSMHSTDRGDTFTSGNVLSNPIVGEDREWMASVGPSTVYMAVHDAATFNINVFRSTDGGQNYTAGYGQGLDPQTFPAAGGVPASNSANVAGTLRADLSQCLSRGNLYTVFVAPDSALENLQGGPLRSIYVGVSSDAKLGLPVYTFTDHKVATFPSSLANLFPSIAVDQLGYVYVVWSDNANVYYSYSTDQANTWSAPIKVNSGPTVGKANVFPWVAADQNGHVAIAWFSSDRAGNSNDTNTLAPCPTDPITGDFTSTDCMKNWANWNVYVAESVNGHAATPTFTVTKASDHVNHRGTISTGGLTGNANRDMGDFFQVSLDPQHRMQLAFSDDHKLYDATATNYDDPSARRLVRAYYTRQVATTAGIVTTGSCAGTPLSFGKQVTGEGGLGTAKFGISAHTSPPNGALSYQDGSMKVVSSNGADLVNISNGCATYTGDAKVNGQLGYRYQVNACDKGDANSGLDTFTLDVTGPTLNYHKTGNLTRGDVSIANQQ